MNKAVRTGSHENRNAEKLKTSVARPTAPKAAAPRRPTMAAITDNGVSATQLLMTKPAGKQIHVPSYMTRGILVQKATYYNFTQYSNE